MLNYIRVIATIYLLLLVIFTQAIAGDTSFEGESDWNMYQYSAHHTGYNVNDQISLPIELKWQKRYQVDSFEFNPPIIVGDRIIVTNRRKNNPIEDVLSVRCIDMKTSNIIWDWNFAGISTIDPPTYWNGLVYCQTNYGGGSLNVFNISDGSLVWSNPYGSQWDKNLGPVVYDAKVLYVSGTYGGFTLADANTGEIFWIKPGGVSEFKAPSMYNNEIFLWQAGTIFNLSIETKELTWRNTIIYPSPSDVGGGPAIDTTENLIFLGNQNNVFAVDMLTHEVLWTNNHPYPSSMSLGLTKSMPGLTPAICDDKLYYINQDSLYCSNKFTGESVWKYGTDSQFWSPPVIANGLLFVTTQDSTFAFDLTSKEKVWTFPVGGKISVGNNHLVLGSIEGELYVFGRVATDIEDNFTDNIPEGFELYQNYPNPFNPTTEIKFTIPNKSNVTIDIINIAGQKVRTLTNQTYSAGNHTVTWNGKDDKGTQLSSGIYLYRLVIGNITLKKKMVLLK